MTLIGTPPAEWVNLIDSLVPDILELVLSTWNQMPSLAPDTHENPITKDLCRLMILNKKSSELPFRISYRSVELSPLDGADTGEMDIAFYPAGSSREDIYFCLECKRLHVTQNGKFSTLATEYVTQGMMRFISGKYAPVVQSGGMIGYVFDGNVSNAIQAVEKAVKTRHETLRMKPPGKMQPSSIYSTNTNIKETHHTRKHDNNPFQIHHIFISNNNQ